MDLITGAMRAPLTSDEVLPRNRKRLLIDLTCQWPNELNKIGARLKVVAINDKLIVKITHPEAGNGPFATKNCSDHGHITALRCPR